ncbi:MAG: hypothetical protein KY412_01000 [Actinobacteria bacterium]|nr:hypothetical protein [Actinomycetota bacterium]
MKQQLTYLDAGTGSLIVSVVVAGAAGLGVILRLTWRRIVGFFSPKRRAEQRAEAQHAAEQGAGDHDSTVSERADAPVEPRA